MGSITKRGKKIEEQLTEVFCNSRLNAYLCREDMTEVASNIRNSIGDKHLMGLLSLYKQHGKEVDNFAEKYAISKLGIFGLLSMNKAKAKKLLYETFITVDETLSKKGYTLPALENLLKHK